MSLTEQAPPSRAAERPDDPERIALYRFLAPRYWGVWLGVGIVRTLNLLPLKVQLACGRALGMLAYYLSRRDRRVAQINVDLCLPGLNRAERRALVRAHFGSLGCAVIETGLVWWANERRLRSWIRVEGTEHLDAALAKGHGAVLLSAHFTVLELGARTLTLLRPTSIMYLTPSNPLIAEFSRRMRTRHTVQSIRSDQVRDLLKNLKCNLPVWYAPDQRFTDKNSEIVTLLGQPASSNVSTPRIARISGASVLPFFPERLADNSGYLVRILPPLENFPSDDAVADTRRFHELIEAQIARTPEQYLWSYKRFRVPGPDGDPYRR